MATSIASFQRPAAISASGRFTRSRFHPVQSHLPLSDTTTPSTSYTSASSIYRCQIQPHLALCNSSNAPTAYIAAVKNNQSEQWMIQHCRCQIQPHRKLVLPPSLPSIAFGNPLLLLLNLIQPHRTSGSTLSTSHRPPIPRCSLTLLPL